MSKPTLRGRADFPALADVLRQAIRDSGVSQQEVSRRTGVPAPVISRFLSGQRDLTLDTAEKLVVYLDLELRRRAQGQ
jgi:plasmid maintenance system antidote protein VapI